MQPYLKRAVLDFLQERGCPEDPVHSQRLAGDGSRRVFWRIRWKGSADSFIVMSNPPVDFAAGRENSAYLWIGQHLYSKGIPVPEIHSWDLETGWFLMEDMGCQHLQDAAVSGQDPMPLYQEVLKHLLRLQIDGASNFDPAWCCQTGRYDRRVMLRYEADYFVDAFLGRYLGIGTEGRDLSRAFGHLAEVASKADANFFLHRDFQSRNIMLRGGRVGFVDWQGGRLGPLAYDLASLIIDPYVHLSKDLKSAIRERYLDLLRRRNPAWADAVERYYPYLAIQRSLQILGAFAYLTRVMHKTYFEVYMPEALQTLDVLLHQVPDSEISGLRDLVVRLKSQKKILDIAPRSR